MSYIKRCPIFFKILCESAEIYFTFLFSKYLKLVHFLLPQRNCTLYSGDCNKCTLCRTPPHYFHLDWSVEAYFPCRGLSLAVCSEWIVFYTQFRRIIFSYQDLTKLKFSFVGLLYPLIDDLEKNPFRGYLL